MLKSEYIIGTITGAFIGAIGLKLMELFRGGEASDDELSSDPQGELKDALLSHALQVLYPNRTSPRYYIYSGKYLPTFDTFNATNLYTYMAGHRRQGIRQFLKRYLSTKEQQQRFFDVYWTTIHASE